MARSLLALAFLFFLGSGSAEAGTNYVWAGGAAGSWGTNTNWTPNGVPVSGDTISVNVAAVISLDGNQALAGITFDTASDVTLQQGTGGTLTLDAGGSITRTAASTGLHVISCPLALGGALSVTNNNAASSLTLSGVLSGAGGAPSLNGTGLVILSGNNTYAGGTTFAGAGVEVGHNNALGSGAVTLSANTALSSSLANPTLANAFTLNAAKTLSLTVPAPNTMTLSGVVSGAGALSLGGTGKVILSGNNAYAGGTTFAGAGVEVGHNNALGSGTVTLSANTALSSSLANPTLANAFALNAAQTLSVTVPAAPNTMTFSGNLTGTGTLQAAGGGTLAITLSNAAFSGTVTLNGVTLNVPVSQALGGAAATLSVTADSILQSGTAPTFVTAFDGNDTLVLKNGGVVVDVFGQVGNDPGGNGWGTDPLSTAGHVLRRLGSVVAGQPGGFVSLADLSNEWAQAPADTTAGLGAHSVTPAPAGTLFFSEYADGPGENKALEICNGNDTTSVPLSNIRIELYRNGAAAPNSTFTFSGGSLAPGGVLVLAHNGADDPNITGAKDATDSISSVIRLDNAVSLGGAKLTVIPVELVELRLTGALGETAASVLEKKGAGLLQLSGASGHSGGTLLDGGTLQIDNGGALGSGPATVISQTTLTTGTVSTFVSSFDGNDALVLRNKTTDTILDAIGELGVNPNPDWLGVRVSTKNRTVRRKSSVSGGDANGFDDRFQFAEGWDGFAVDTFGGLGAHAGGGSPADLFFSEYVHGTGANTALEIFNGTGAPVNLATYSVEIYKDGAAAAAETLDLSAFGPIASGDVLVITNNGADPAILAQADVIENPAKVTNFDGNDALVLKKNGVILDVIGRIGENPVVPDGSLDRAWVSSTVATSGRTIRRKDTVAAGDPDGFQNGGVFDPAEFSSQWDGFAAGTSAGLGVHSPSVGTTGLFFSEYVEAGGDNKALEIYNGTGAGVDLSDYVVEIYEGGAAAPTSVLPLGTDVLPAGDVVVITNINAADPGISGLTPGGTLHKVVSDSFFLSIDVGNNFTLQDELVVQTPFADSIKLSGALQDGAFPGKLRKFGSGTLHVTGAANGYTGGTRLDQGILLVGAASALGTGGLTVGSSSTLVPDPAAPSFTLPNNISIPDPPAFNVLKVITPVNFTLGGVISGGGSLAKEGAGALTLAGVNTYSGGTGLSGGPVLITNASAFGSGEVQVSADSSLQVSNAAGITLANGFNLQNELETTGADNLTLQGVLRGGGGFRKTGGHTLNLNGANTLTGPVNLSGGRVGIGSDSALGSGEVTLNSDLLMNATVASASIPNRITGPGALTLTVDGANDLRLGGELQGPSLTLVKNGSGRLSLAHANSYGTDLTESTLFNAGTLAVGHNSALGSKDLRVDTASPKVLTTDTAFQNSALSFDGNDVVVLTKNDVIVDMIGSLTPPNNGLGSPAADRYGSGVVSTKGHVIRRLSAQANAPGGFANPLDITDQWEQTPSDSTAGLGAHSTSAASSELFFSEYVELGGNENALEVFNGTGAAVDLSAYAIEIYQDLSTEPTRRLALGTLGSLADNSTLVVAHGAASPALQALANLTDPAPANLTLGAVINLAHASDLGVLLPLTDRLTLQGLVKGPGGLAISGGGTLAVNAANTYTGNTDIRDQCVVVVGVATAFGPSFNTLSVSGTGGTLIAAVGPMNLGYPVTLAGPLTVDGGNDLELSGVLSGAAGLTKNGLGTLTLSNANTYGGNTNLNSGRLLLGRNSALGAGGTFHIAGGQVEALGGARTIGNALSLDGSFALAGANGLTFGSGPLTADVTVSVLGSFTASFGALGQSGGNRNLTLDAASSGTLRLSGVNTFTDLKVSGGRLQLASNNAAGGGIFQWTGGTVEAFGGSRTMNNPLSVGGTVAVSGSNPLIFTGAAALSANVNLTLSNTTTFSGGIGGGSNGLTLDAASSGTLIVSTVAATYTGDSTVNGGVLRADTTLASRAVVGAFGALEGLGEVAGLVCRGRLSPGTDTVRGVLSVNGDLTFQNGALLKVQVSGAPPSDQVRVLGAGRTVSLGNELCALEVTDNGTAHGNAFRIIEALAAGSTQSGVFVGLPQAIQVSASNNGAGLTVLYQDGADANDVVLLKNESPTGQNIVFNMDMNPDLVSLNQLFVPFAGPPAVPNLLDPTYNMNDADGDTFEVVRVSGPLNNASGFGAARDFQFDGVAGSFRYTPAPGFFGIDRIFFQIKDSLGGLSAVHEIQINVNEVLPRITQMPADQTDIVKTPSGTSFTLSVDAVGKQPLSYQWFRGESPDMTDPVLFEPTATTANYSTPLLTKAGIYKFWVLVSNPFGIVLSTTATITLRPGVLAELEITGWPSPYVRTTPQGFTITAQDAFDNTITDYAGTVAFSSSDPAKVLPAAYTFLPGDVGVHSFSGNSLNTLGLHDVTASDAALGISTAKLIRVNNLPVVQTPLAIVAGSPPTAGLPVTLLTNVTDDEALTYFWDFGDGTTDPDGGNQQVHLFTPAGPYTITVQAIDIFGQFTEQTLVINVVADVSGPNGEFDSDGDGFADEIETALGTDPSDNTDTPFGGAPAGPVKGLPSARLRIRLNFRRAGRDSITLRAVMDPPAGFVPAGARVITDVGGVVRDFLLDSRGRSPRGLERLVVRLNRRTGQAIAVLRMRRGDFAAFLADEQLLNETVVRVPRQVGVAIILPPEFNQAAVPQIYTARLDRTGRTR